jgi:hypothetical protein
MMFRASISAGDTSPDQAILEEFVDAVVGDDSDRADEARANLIDRLGPDWLVDASAVVANFQMMTRLADGTGARLPPARLEAAAALIDELGLAKYPSTRI